MSPNQGLTVVLLLAMACTAQGATGQTRTAAASPHAKLRGVGLTDVRWTDGLWAEKLKLCRTATVPTIRQALLDPTNSAQLANFRVAAGLEEGKHRGTNWSDGDCYKWLEAASLLYAVTGDPQLKRWLDAWIGVIAQAQRPDGFLSTNAQLRDDCEPLDMPYTHQLYNMGHLLTAACVHHEATGEETFLRIARKTADFLHRTFAPRPPRLVHFPWNPSLYMGLVDFYRTTGERRYLELAEVMIGNRGSSPGGGTHRNGGTDQTQDRVPIRQETEAVGHAVCAMYLYCGAADLVAETGDAALLAALQRIWRNVTERKMYITGAVGSGGGRSARGDPVHEAFLDDYQLPVRTAYAETCANIGNAMWNQRMLSITGEAKYADIMETVLYNSALSALGADGTTFFYCNPVVWHGQKGRKHHTGQRWTIHGCYCCPPQVARTLAKLHTWAYGASEDAVWVHLYGGSRLKTALPDGTAIRLNQETDYPWDGNVKLTIGQAPARPVGIKLRIPGWAEDATVTVNGQSLGKELRPATYATVRRSWKEGDAIELNLPMDVRLMEAHPKVKGLRNKVAVVRGPVVYCLEAPLSEGGKEMWDRGGFLPENVQFTTRHEPDLLGGITVLEGTALTWEGRDRFVKATADVPLPAERRDWGGALYRPLHPRTLEPPTEGTTPIRLIPYFAWANRGLSYMEVWIPLARPSAPME